MIEPVAIVPFIPSGADFAASRRLFGELGAVELWEGGGCVGFRWGAAKFILQTYDVPEFAGNLMLKIEVPDVDAWYAAVEAARVAETFPGVTIRPPKEFPWGREVHFIDLAGVLWQIRRA